MQIPKLKLCSNLATTTIMDFSPFINQCQRWRHTSTSGSRKMQKMLNSRVKLFSTWAWFITLDQVQDCPQISQPIILVNPKLSSKLTWIKLRNSTGRLWKKIQKLRHLCICSTSTASGSLSISTRAYSKICWSTTSSRAARTKSWLSACLHCTFRYWASQCDSYGKTTVSIVLMYKTWNLL